ncbi:MAG: response regulator transcription factor [Rhodothermaceae bacterium]|nr:response regulator transcription factor [Rhodothermaceae bacterium]
MAGTTKDISVWVVDDHHDFRETVQELLSSQPDMNCTAVFASCERMLDQIDSLPKADVVIMDINFKGRMSGIEGILQMRARIPDIRVLVLSMYADEDLIFDSLRSGAIGYLFKMGNPERIIEGIREISRMGALPLPVIVSGKILAAFQSSKDVKPEDRLTQHETSLLEAIKNGSPFNQLADLLKLDQSEIESCMNAIYHKLHHL